MGEVGGIWEVGGGNGLGGVQITRHGQNMDKLTLTQNMDKLTLTKEKQDCVSVCVCARVCVCVCVRACVHVHVFVGIPR